LFQLIVGRGVLIVAVDVLEQSRQPGKSIVVDTTEILQTVMRSLTQLLQGPARARYADDRDIKVAALNQPLQRREDLFVSQVAGGPEENERV
jgi:hypothetical protein